MAPTDTIIPVNTRQGTQYQYNGQQYNSMGAAVAAKNNTTFAANAAPLAPAKAAPVPAGAAQAPISVGGAPATKTPVTPAGGSPTPTGSETGDSSILTANPDISSLLGGAQGAEDFLINPEKNAPGGFEESLYAKYLQEAQPDIAATEEAFNQEIAGKEAVGTEQEAGTGAALVAAGLGGSTAAAAAMGKAAGMTADDINTLIASRGQAIQSVLAQVRQDAETNAPTLAANAIAAVQAIGKNYINLQNLKAQFPDDYNSIVTAFGGDENAAIAASSISAPSVIQSYVQGQNYVQVVQDPQTGVVHAQTFALGVTPPVGWTAQKLSNAIVFTDPNNAANSITYTTNPLTGALTVNATGTGLQNLNAAGINSGDPAPTGSNATTSTGATNASTTIASLLGVTDPTTPLSTVVSTSGLGNIVGAMIKNEGGSPAGVINNPGNIKFAGLPGQTDSGVKASDGGTYASYSTPQDGQEAIGNLVNEAAGKGLSLQDFVNSYTGSSSGQNTNGMNPETGLSTTEYGSLADFTGTASVPKFDPGTPGSSANTEAQDIDADAAQYIKKYFSTGSYPTARDLGISTRAGSGGIFSTIVQRANDLLSALGVSLPNATTLNNNLGLISNNNSLLNNLSVQTGTIEKNFGLNLDNLNANTVNQAAPVINKMVDYLAQANGDVPVAQYLAQNQTIQQELGSLLAVKNASGTTVADKLAAGDLLPSDLSADQQKAILNVLMKEAKNQQQTIGKTNADLYAKTDPLGLDPNNPINAPGYKQLTGQGFTDAYDGTWTDPNGTSGYTVSGNILTSPDGSKSWDLTQ